MRQLSVFLAVVVLWIGFRAGKMGSPGHLLGAFCSAPGDSGGSRGGADHAVFDFRLSLAGGRSEQLHRQPHRLQCSFQPAGVLRPGDPVQLAVLPIAECDGAGRISGTEWSCGSFNSGAARFQGSYGVAQLMGNQLRRKATRVYTNPDVARLNDSNGVIRYGGKLAHLD